MTRKSCAVWMRNAILRNHLKLWRYVNCPDQPITIKFDHVLESHHGHVALLCASIKVMLSLLFISLSSLIYTWCLLVHNPAKTSIKHVIRLSFLQNSIQKLQNSRASWFLTGDSESVACFQTVKD